MFQRFSRVMQFSDNPDVISFFSQCTEEHDISPLEQTLITHVNRNFNSDGSGKTMFMAFFWYITLCEKK